MTKRTIEKAAVAIVTGLVGACSTEVGDERGRQGVSDGDAASSGGAYGHAAGSGGVRAAGGAATGGSSIGGAGGGAGGRDATTIHPAEPCLPPLAPDAGSTVMYECSKDITRTTSWDPTMSDCGVLVGVPGCPVRWGCGAFDFAREAVCNDAGLFFFGQYEGRELGFLVIGASVGGAVVRAYYDEAMGEMVGYFWMDDVGRVMCAGRVPKETFGGQRYATDIVPLCAPDGGVLVDAGSGGPSVDAGDSG